MKFRDQELGRAYTLDAKRVQALGKKAGIELRHVRPMSGDRQVFAMPMRIPATAVDDIVDYAEETADR